MLKKFTSFYKKIKISSNIKKLIKAFFQENKEIYKVQRVILGESERKGYNWRKKRLTVERQSSKNCDWRTVPRNSRADHRRSRASWRVLSSKFTCTEAN